MRGASLVELLIAAGDRAGDRGGWRRARWSRRPTRSRGSRQSGELSRARRRRGAAPHRRSDRRGRRAARPHRPAAGPLVAPASIAAVGVAAADPAARRGARRRRRRRRRGHRSPVDPDRRRWRAAGGRATAAAALGLPAGADVPGARRWLRLPRPACRCCGSSHGPASSWAKADAVDASGLDVPGVDAGRGRRPRRRRRDRQLPFRRGARRAAARPRRRTRPAGRRARRRVRRRAAGATRDPPAGPRWPPGGETCVTLADGRPASPPWAPPGAPSSGSTSRGSRMGRGAARRRSASTPICSACAASASGCGFEADPMALRGRIAGARVPDRPGDRGGARGATTSTWRSTWRRRRCEAAVVSARPRGAGQAQRAGARRARRRAASAPCCWPRRWSIARRAPSALVRARSRSQTSAAARDHAEVAAAAAGRPRASPPARSRANQTSPRCGSASPSAPGWRRQPCHGRRRDRRAGADAASSSSAGGGCRRRPMPPCGGRICGAASASCCRRPCGDARPRSAGRRVGARRRRGRSAPDRLELAVEAVGAVRRACRAPWPRSAVGPRGVAILAVWPDAGIAGPCVTRSAGPGAASRAAASCTARYAAALFAVIAGRRRRMPGRREPITGRWGVC